jgi:hypothetical protein
MVLFVAMLQVVVAAPMAPMAAMAATAAPAARQHPSLRERVLHVPQELPINEA